MEELKEAFIKKNPQADNNVNGNIKNIEKISAEERPFSPVHLLLKKAYMRKRTIIIQIGKVIGR